MDESTAGNTQRQLAGSGVWVQVAETFKSGRKIQKLHASGKGEECRVRLSGKKSGRVARGVEQGI